MLSDTWLSGQTKQKIWSDTSAELTLAGWVLARPKGIAEAQASDRAVQSVASLA